MQVAYITDVEGMWQKLESFASGNPGVSLDGSGLRVAPGWRLVFGGDAMDRGDGGRRVVRALLEAKRRQPDHVVLLAGNRDINKLRLWRELNGRPLPKTPRELASGPRGPLLRWIFANTMGARNAFEHRRVELRGEGLPSGDEDVAQSYLDELSEGGAMRSFLEACEVAHREGDTLYVHGGVTEQSLFHTPRGETEHDVDAWIAELNRWYRSQLEAFAEGGGGDPLAWSELIAYQAPSPGLRANRASVVYGRNVDPLNNPMLPPPEVVAALRERGIGRLVVGHTPNGDTPSLVRCEGFEVAVADASHSRVATAPKVFLGPGLTAEGETELDGGERAAVRLAVDPGDPAIGLRDPESGYLVKGRLGDGRYLLFRYLEGYRFEQRPEDEKALRRRRLAPAGWA